MERADGRDKTLTILVISHVHMSNQHSGTVFAPAVTIGDKNERRRNQRADKAASVAALLQHAISDDRFAIAVQELETSFGAKFSDFITGRSCCLLLHGYQMQLLCTSCRMCNCVAHEGCNCNVPSLVCMSHMCIVLLAHFVLGKGPSPSGA